MNIVWLAHETAGDATQHSYLTHA